MLNNLNSIIIEGDLIADPILEKKDAGSPKCTFTVASNRYFKGNDQIEKEVSYFLVVAHSKLGQICWETAKKGRRLRIIGRLKQYRWTDDEGKDQSQIKVVAEHVEFKPV